MLNHRSKFELNQGTDRRAANRWRQRWIIIFLTPADCANTLNPGDPSWTGSAEISISRSAQGPHPPCTCSYLQVRVMQAERDFSFLITGKYSWHESPARGAKRSFLQAGDVARACLRCRESRNIAPLWFFSASSDRTLLVRRGPRGTQPPRPSLGVINHLCDIYIYIRGAAECFGEQEVKACFSNYLNPSQADTNIHPGAACDRAPCAQVALGVFPWMKAAR